jgi:hypothetical protein
LIRVVACTWSARRGVGKEAWGADPNSLDAVTVLEEAPDETVGTQARGSPVVQALSPRPSTLNAAMVARVRTCRLIMW